MEPALGERGVGPSVLVRAVLLLALVVVVAALATARLFVWPPSNTPTSADAVVVLSGDHGERLARALALVHSGAVHTLVHVGQPDSEQARQLCAVPQGFDTVCLLPTPDNTRAEAEAVGRVVRNRDWRRVVVVTSTQHVARAGLLFRRCVEGDVDMMAARPPFGLALRARLIAEEWAKLAYSVTVRRSC